MVFKNAHNAPYGYKKDKDVTMSIVNVELIFVMYVCGVSFSDDPCRLR